MTTPAHTPGNPEIEIDQPRRSQAERRAETQARLLEACIALLKTKGYSRFRTADAAALAGVSRGAQVYYFGTKDEMIEAAIESLFEREAEAARNNPEPNVKSDPVGTAAGYIERFFRDTLYKVCLRLIVSAGSTEHFADGVRAIAARHRHSLDQPWIDRLAEIGKSDRRAEEAFGILSNSLKALEIEESIGDERGDAPAVRELTMSLVRDYLAESDRPDSA